MKQHDTHRNLKLHRHIFIEQSYTKLVRRLKCLDEEYQNNNCFDSIERKKIFSKCVKTLIK